VLLLAAGQAMWAAGAPGALDGTDRHGRTVDVRTTTDADGRYTDGLPAGPQFTTPEDPAATGALDSDADPRTGRASVSLPDRSPTATVM
jgi:hypothetical protein